MTPVEQFIELVPDHETLDAILGELTAHELATVFHAWREFWARPEQLFPDGAWETRFYIGARRAGKTRSVSEWIQDEVQKIPRAKVLLMAQNEKRAREIFAEDEAGLLETSPPWNRCRFEPSTLSFQWDNGASAHILTPERPENIRGVGYTHAALTELQSWPRATREQAWMNTIVTVSAPPAKMAGDCTPPKRGRNPLLDELLAQQKADPERNLVVHAAIEDNAANLAPGHVEKARRKVVGANARAELDGIYDPDAQDGALWDQDWIDNSRREAPARYVRRVIAIDPAIGTEETSDLTGMMDVGLGPDDQVYPIADYSGRHEAHVWADKALDLYVDGECDLIIAELNRGGNLVTRNLRASAAARGLRVEVVDAKWRPHRTPGVVYVREIHSKGAKADRAAPVATLYELGKVSHVKGAPLTKLEQLLTGWIPPPDGVRGGTRRSPDAMDALVMAVVELAGLARDPAPDYRKGFEGASDAAKRVAQPPAGPERPIQDPLALLRRESPWTGRGGMGL